MPCIRPSGTRPDHVPGRSGRVPPARPPGTVQAPALLPPHRRVGRPESVRGQAVVRPASGKRAAHGRHSGRHVVSVRPGVGPVRLQAKVLGQVVRVVPGECDCSIGNSSSSSSNGTELPSIAARGSAGPGEEGYSPDVVTRASPQISLESWGNDSVEDALYRLEREAAGEWWRRSPSGPEPANPPVP